MFGQIRGSCPQHCSHFREVNFVAADVLCISEWKGRGSSLVMERLTANGNVLEHSRKLVRVLVELLTEVSRKLPALELTKQSHLDAMDPPGRGAWECRELPGVSWTQSSGTGMVGFYPAA